MVQLRPWAMYLISFGAIIACIIVIPWRAEIGWPVMIKIHKIWWKIVHIVLVITKQWWDYRWYKYEACSTGYSKLCTWVSVSYSATCRDTKHKDWIYKSWVCHARLHSEDTKMASLGKIQSLNTPSCNPVYTKWGSKVMSVARPERLSTPWCKGIWWGN